MKYSVTVQDREIEVDLSGPHAVVDGRPLSPAELTSALGSSVRHVRIGNAHHTLIAEANGGPGRWRIRMAGRSVEIEVLDERTRAIREMAGDDHAEAPVQIVAPMPGLVVRVNVAPGDSVQAGQGLVVVEAMKMENELRAAGPGTVARVEVEPGDAVEKGAVLITFEPPVAGGQESP